MRGIAEKYLCMNANKDSTMLQIRCHCKLDSFMKLVTTLVVVVVAYGFRLAFGGTGLGSEKVKTIHTDCGSRGAGSKQVHSIASHWYWAWVAAKKSQAAVLHTILRVGPWSLSTAAQIRP